MNNTDDAPNKSVATVNNATPPLLLFIFSFTAVIFNAHCWAFSALNSGHSSNWSRKPCSTTANLQFTQTNFQCDFSNALHFTGDGSATYVKRVETSKSRIDSDGKDSDATQSINVIAAADCGLTKSARYTYQRHSGEAEINASVDQCVDSEKLEESEESVTYEKRVKNAKKLCVRKLVVQTESWKTANAIKRVEVQYRGEQRTKEQDAASVNDRTVGAESAITRKAATGGQMKTFKLW